MNIIQELKQMGFEDASLDEIVQDAAASMASNANNEGMDGQINFLTIVAGWSNEDILDALNNY